MKSGSARRFLLLRPLPAGSYSYSSARLGGNFPISVAIRKSITALSHFSMESSSETCTCWHLPALHPVAFPTSFQSVFCWSFHRLQWRKRCSRVWATVLPPPPHHQHLSLSRCPNRFRYVPTGAPNSGFKLVHPSHCPWATVDSPFGRSRLFPFNGSFSPYRWVLYHANELANELKNSIAQCFNGLSPKRV